MSLGCIYNSCPQQSARDARRAWNRLSKKREIPITLLRCKKLPEGWTFVAEYADGQSIALTKKERENMRRGEWTELREDIKSEFSKLKLTSETERAWAAGFFDGEGSVSRCRSGGSGRYYPSIHVSQVNPIPLIRFSLAVGLEGCVRGPYIKRSNKCKPVWIFTGRSVPKTLRIAYAIGAYLSAPKLEQFLNVTNTCIDTCEKIPIHRLIRNTSGIVIRGGAVRASSEEIMTCLTLLREHLTKLLTRPKPTLQSDLNSLQAAA